MNEDPYTIDKHLRPLWTFNIENADFVGRFERLKKDWETLAFKYALGPFIRPEYKVYQYTWDEVVTKDELMKVVDYYSRDFEQFKYDANLYCDSTRLDELTAKDKKQRYIEFE